MSLGGWLQTAQKPRGRNQNVRPSTDASQATEGVESLSEDQGGRKGLQNGRSNTVTKQLGGTPGSNTGCPQGFSHVQGNLREEFMAKGTGHVVEEGCEAERIFPWSQPFWSPEGASRGPPGDDGWICTRLQWKPT